MINSFKKVFKITSLEKVFNIFVINTTQKQKNTNSSQLIRFSLIILS